VTAAGHSDPPPTDPALVLAARAVLDHVHYGVLGTLDPDRSARVSPVYLTHHLYTHFYWVSSPTSHHSINLERDPRVSIVVFDSTRAPADTEAVYLTGHAQQVTEPQLPQVCRVAFQRLHPGAVAMTPAQLSGTADLRLYRASIDRAETHIRGANPRWGDGVDRRVAVALARH